jgi:uncharacterized protein (DUF305 family)
MDLFTGKASDQGVRVTIRIVLALMVVVGVVLVSQSSALAQQPRLDPAPDPRVAGIEQDFLMGMIPHHRGAIMMSELALQKATRDEVRELARHNIEDQTREIALMTNWLRDWYGASPPAGNTMPTDIMRRMDMPMMRGAMPSMQEQMARMQRLATLSGPAFDVEYMSLLTQHHGMATMMAAPVLIKGHHAALYDLAATISADQGEQILEMRQLLSEYGVERALNVNR